MQVINISKDKKSTYILKEDEKVVFFLLNRSGDMTFKLTCKGAEAHIFAFFIGQVAETNTLNIIQQHQAPQTTSRALVKSVLLDTAAFTYNGLIRIERQAILSDAAQESRSLLLSPEAHISTRPALEILADDVKCRHAATVSSLNTEQLFFAQTRGLSKTQATQLLVDGFLNEALEKIDGLADAKHRMNIETLGLQKVLNFDF